MFPSLQGAASPEGSAKTLWVPPSGTLGRGAMAARAAAACSKGGQHAELRG